MTAALPDKKRVHRAFEAYASLWKDRIAIEHGTEQITYQELSKKTNILAYRLQKHGVQKKSIVAIALPTGIDYVVAILAVMKAGGTFLPLDPLLPEHRLQYMLQKTPPTACLTSKEAHILLREKCKQWTDDTSLLFLKEDCAADTSSEAQNPPRVDTHPDDPCYIMYTSGSTGEPKAFVGCHKSLSHFIHWEIKEFSLKEDIKVTQLAPVTFDASLRDIFVPLFSGGTLCIPEQKIRDNITKLLEWLENSAITLVHCVPSMFRLLTEELGQPDTTDSASQLAALRLILMAGDALYYQDIEHWRNVVGNHVKLVNLYGPSETTMVKTFHRITTIPKKSNAISAMVSIGQPISNTAVLIIQDDRLCDIDEPGEIMIKTPFRTLGYYGEPELTRQKFIQNPLHDTFEDIVYITGDRGRYAPDRSIEFIGRADKQVKIGGVRIELGEIEQALSRVEGVEQAVVLAHEAHNHEKQLAAYYTTNQEIQGVKVRKALAAHLPTQLIPSSFTQLKKFPLNTNGKIDRAALPKPEQSWQNQENENIAPDNATEITLLNIWKKVLKISDIGVTSHFLDIGGHSLKALRIVSGIYRELEREISLKDFFEHPTIRELANFITHATISSDLTIEQAPQQKDYPLSSAQRRLWLISRMQNNHNAAYSIPAAFEMTGPLNQAAFEETLQLLIQRHESLRTVFIEINGEPRQKIKQQGNIALEWIDSSTSSSKEEDFAKIQKKHQATSFDLEAGPLLRITLVKLSTNCHQFLFNIHHIIADRWSLNVLIAEIATLYTSIIHEKQQPLLSLNPLKIQYKDYTLWQKNFLAQARADKHKKYWHNQFATEVPALDLPRDFVRPDVQSLAGDAVTIRLEKEVFIALKAFIRQHDISLFVALHALVNTLIYRYTGENDIVLGSVIAGRNQDVLHNQVGFFMNVLAFRNSIDGNNSLNDLLQQVKQTCMEAYEHQAYPFDQLVEELNIQRDLGRSPLFDIAIDVQEEDEKAFGLQGLSVTSLKETKHVSKYDLFFSFIDQGEGLQLDLIYNTDLFRHERIQRMGEHFTRLVQTALSCSEQSLDALDLVAPKEKELFQAVSTAAQRPYPEAATIVSLFEEQVQQTPDAVAVIFGSRELTYQELNEQANQIAFFLRQNNAVQGSEAPVALLYEASETFIIGLLGILKAGAVYLPIIPELPQDRILFMLRDSNCSLLITINKECSIQWADQVDCPVLSLSEIQSSPASAEQKKGPSDTAQKIELSSSSLAYIIYTSGTTGWPKGVLLEHGGFVNMILSQIALFGIEPTDRVLQFSSPSFDASMSEIFMALLSGASLALIEQTTKQDKDQLLSNMHALGVNTVTLPPTYLHLLGFHNLRFLKTLITAGEPAITDSGKFVDNEHHYWNAYGPTEYSVCASCYPIPAQNNQVTIPIGRPIANTEILILNQCRYPQPIGIPGEIFLSGPGVARGYLNLPEQTAKSFIEHPWQPGKKMYRTGDIGCWNPDGTINYVERNDTQIKIRGYRIETNEVTEALRKVPGVEQAAVHHVAGTQNGPLALAGYYTLEKKPEFWPSVAEFFIYDDVLYGAMAGHELRNQRYLNAFKRVLSGKTIVEIGPGPEVILSRLALQAGAKKSYAIEYLKESYDKASEKIQQLGLQEKIILLHGDATKKDLPEKVDYCISEIVGGIGGSEGSAKIINAARRFLKEPTCMIPQRSVTKIAACALPDDLEYAFPELAGHYIQKIFDEKGYPFDLRLCLKHISEDILLSSKDIFENLDYTENIDLEHRHTIHLEFKKSGLFKGFLVWLTLDIDEENSLDILDSPESWLPVFLSCSVEGIPVEEGDSLDAEILRTLCANGLNPDFALSGTLKRKQGPAIDIQVQSLHDQPLYQQTPFYQHIFANGEIPLQTTANTAALRKHLSTLLPSYMVPQYLLEIEKLPLTNNGKVDFKALPAPELAQSDETQYVAPVTTTEKRWVKVWQDILGLNAVGMHDNFFDLGGNSFHAVQMVARAKTELAAEIAIKELFAHPTIADLIQNVEKQSKREGGSETFSDNKRTLSCRKNREAAGYVQTDSRPLLALFACNKIPPVDAAALSCFSPDILDSLQLDRSAFLSRYCQNLPLITKVMTVGQQRIAHIHLPLFSDEISSNREHLCDLVVDGLELAKSLGACQVSLTGMLPAATNLGRAVLNAPLYHAQLPPLTTGQATVASVMVMSIAKLLNKAEREFHQEDVAFLGLGNMGAITLQLMLQVLPHPRSLILCEHITRKKDLEQLQYQLQEKDGYKGKITCAYIQEEIPDSFYTASVMMETVSMPGMLDINRLRKSTLLVGASPPHSFDTAEAFSRFAEKKDILYTEGDVLALSEPITSLHYLPDSFTLEDIEEKHAVFFQNTITGCIYSSLLPLLNQNLNPIRGRVALDEAVEHYHWLCKSGLEAADPHCVSTILPSDTINLFQENYGAKK